jgi:hypothetical protein
MVPNMMRRTLRRRGTTLVYSAVAMISILMFVSLAVDMARVQVAKTELERASDAAARYGAAGLAQGASAVQTRVATAGTDNKVDGIPLVIDPNSDLDFGTWDPATERFDVLTGSDRDSATAIRVTARRSASRNTGIPTLFAAAMGKRTMDITAISIASRGKIVTQSVNALGCPWLAGMPTGSTVAATGGNPTPASAPANAPFQVSGLSIAGGVQICFRQTAGQTGYINATSNGPDGDPTWIVAQDPANGINTTAAPITALMGIFLDSRQPSTYTQAGSLDFSTFASRDFSSLSPQLKQVFFIGDGMNSSGQLQVFNVPIGATRLYLGIMDEKGWWWDNTGTLTCTMLDSKVQMVK